MHEGAHDEAVAALRLLTGGSGHERCRDGFDLIVNNLDGEVSVSRAGVTPA